MFGSAYARNAQFPVKKMTEAKHRSDRKETRGRATRTSSSLTPSRRVADPRIRSSTGSASQRHQSESLLASSSVTNRRRAVSVGPKHRRGQERRPTETQFPSFSNTNKENQQSFPAAVSTLTITGWDRSPPEMSQLSAPLSQDFASVASTQHTSNQEPQKSVALGNFPPPLQENFVVSNRGPSRTGSYLLSQGSFQKSASSCGSVATNLSAVSSNNSNNKRSHSSQTQVSFAPSVGASNASSGKKGFESSSWKKSQPSTAPQLGMTQPPALSQGSYSSHGSNSSSNRRNHATGGAGSSGGLSKLPIMHQRSWNNSTLSTASLSVASSKETSSQQTGSGPTVNVSEDHAKALVKAEMNACLVEMKQLHVLTERRHNERLADADNLHSERIQELDSKKQVLDKMIKAVEGTVAKVSQIAEMTMATFDKARSDLVESSLPFLKHPVTKLVETLFGELLAKTLVDDSLVVVQSLTATKTSSQKAAPPASQVTKKNAKNKTVDKGPQSKDSHEITQNKMDSKRSKSVPKKDKSKQNISSSYTKKASTTSSSKHLFSPESKSPFMPLTLVGVQATKTCTDDLLDNVILVPASKTKQSCVTPCDKGTFQAFSSTDYSDFSQDSSCLTDSPLATTKKRNPQLPKRGGRSKKARATYGGGSRPRDTTGVLNDFSFL